MGNFGIDTAVKGGPGVFFKAGFVAFCVQKEVVEPTSLVLNPLQSDQQCLFII